MLLSVSYQHKVTLQVSTIRCVFVGGCRVRLDGVAVEVCVDILNRLGRVVSSSCIMWIASMFQSDQPGGLS